MVYRIMVAYRSVLVTFDMVLLVTLLNISQLNRILTPFSSYNIMQFNNNFVSYSLFVYAVVYVFVGR